MRHNNRLGKSEEYIGPGEYYASTDDIIISTLLGSCIAVALYDISQPVGGLNHFMLPFPKSKENSEFSTSAKYGINAMEILINAILKEGGKKNKLRAKVFGGSAVLDYKKEATYNIPRMNIEFVFRFLETEHIPVDSYSVGGSLPRKIHFFPQTAKVLMRFSHSGNSGLIRRENIYSHKLLEETKNAGKPILF